MALENVLDWIIPLHVLVLAVTGGVFALRISMLGGTMVALGSSMHLVGYVLLMYLQAPGAYEFGSLIQILMYGGMALATLGLLSVLWTVWQRTSLVAAEPRAGRSS